MVQTFDDMLESEATRLGRLRVWARTLLDLPRSATKEHLNNREDFGMNGNAKILVGAIVAVLLLANLASWWFGNLHSRNNIGIEKVSVAQLADAMQQDDFYSTYGDTALLFSAIVATVQHGNRATLVTFATNRPYSVTCQFPSSLTAKVGQTLSVAAPGGSADRQTAGVLLHNCTEN